jgi:hypothetical protein
MWIFRIYPLAFWAMGWYTKEKIQKAVSVSFSALLTAVEAARQVKMPCIKAKI